MAGRFICTVLQVKPFSGYYRSCPTCKRKLGALEFNSILQQTSRYWCRNCHVDWSAKELGLRYCLSLTVSDYSSGMMVVSLFGRALEPIFGLPATQMHKHLNLEDDGMSRHELVLKMLRMLLTGACVELTFARGLNRIHHTENGQTMTSNCVASGVKILGANSNETVLSLLTTQASLSHKSTASPSVGQGPKDEANNLAAANDSFLMTQQNSLVPRHDHDSSSFLYDTQSQTIGAVTQRTSRPLQLESFLETQSKCGRLEFCNDGVAFGVDDVPDLETSQQIIHELESEWEGSQLIQQHHHKQLPNVDFDLALSEDVLSELQQTFDLSRDIEPSPTPTRSTIASRCSLAAAAPDTGIVTPLSKFMGTQGAKSWRPSTTSTTSCYGSPELFSTYKSSHKKQILLGGRVRELSEPSSFSPELFGPTPLVCRYSSSLASVSATTTPSGLRSKAHTPKRSLLHLDSTLTTPLSHAAVSQTSSIVTGSSRLDNLSLCVYTPQNQSKEFHTMSYTVSSPDLFS